MSLAVNETVTVTFENATADLVPSEYSVTGALFVSVAVGNNDPATDTDGDGLLHDIDGDTQFTIFDVQGFSHSSLGRPPVLSSRHFCCRTDL